MAMAQPKITTAKTQPKDKNAVVEHRDDVYVLVIGFEVNNPVYRETPIEFGVTKKVHYVLEDPGHTFMYLTKNLKVTFFYSLGPHAGASTAERALGKGTPEYPIPGLTRLYRLIITESQYEKMLAKGKEYRADVLAGKRYYNIFKNFTCARSARDIIEAGWPAVPAGGSPIGTPIPTREDYVNPYAFYEAINGKFPTAEIKLGENEEEWSRIMRFSNDKPGILPDPSLYPASWKVVKKKNEN
ncbi:hypothetical protein [Chromobacterium sp. ASV23]|uniref:hypothetical protein n=1 Tax=Chromobacterium sp. ASV23 TaxID=2795110 RepID=UPI0018EAB411|nr:hypothetical protein [Chromobacterium sp. ASV23]